MPIEDPIEDEVNIPPGEHLSGSVDLSDRFPDLRKINNEQEVTVFWSYTGAFAEIPEIGRSGGMLVFPAHSIANK